MPESRVRRTASRPQTIVRTACVICNMSAYNYHMVAIFSSYKNHDGTGEFELNNLSKMIGRRISAPLQLFSKRQVFLFLDCK